MSKNPYNYASLQYQPARRDKSPNPYVMATFSRNG